MAALTSGLLSITPKAKASANAEGKYAFAIVPQKYLMARRLLLIPVVIILIILLVRSVSTHSSPLRYGPIGSCYTNSGPGYKEYYKGAYTPLTATRHNSDSCL